MLGSLYATTGKRDQAIVYFKKVTTTHPRDADVRNEYYF